MGSSELAREVSDLEQQAKTLNERLDALMGPCRNELVGPAAEWIRQNARRKVEENADAAQKLGSDKLRMVKAKVEKLIAGMPKVVEEETAPTTWPHKVKREEPRTGYQGARTTSYEEPYFESTFRKVISRLGAILAECGLEKSPRGYGEEWRPVGDKQYRYGIGTGFETRKYGNLTQYVLTFAELTHNQETLQQKRAELEKAKAREMWDSA